MAKKGRCYIVKKVSSGLRDTYALSEVRAGTKVRALEDAPKGSLDVIDVETPSGKIKNVYSFQLGLWGEKTEVVCTPEFGKRRRK